jgi:hypothetical protein
MRQRTIIIIISSEKISLVYRGLKWYGHIELIKEERLTKSVCTGHHHQEEEQE